MPHRASAILLRISTPSDSPCPFCERVAQRRFWLDSPYSVAFEDHFPVSPGHTLVLPRRHVANPLDLGPHEWVDLFELTRRVSSELLDRPEVDALNVGFNAGAAAGQTVHHAHVHVMPRSAGDSDDPRGGVRWVLPGRAQYWDE